MTEDQSYQIEELLLAWHRWQSQYTEAMGFPRCSPSLRDCEIPTKHQTDQERSEVVDAKIFKRNGETIDACVDSLTWQERAALQTNLRNKRTGYEVFKNPRLSQDELHGLYQGAKERLLPMFVSRNLIKPELEAAA
jgi:hypothetical protein